MPARTVLIPVATAAVAALAASVAIPLAAGAATPHGRAALVVRATHSHHVISPATARPGIVHFRNTTTGARPFAEILVVEAKHPSRSSAAQVAAGINGNSPKPLIKNYRLVAFVHPKGGVYTRLTRGVYYLADADANKIKASNIQTMTVSGPRVDARPPKSHGALVSSHDNLHLPSTLPRSGWLHVRDHISAVSSFDVLPVAAKVTAAQLRSLVAHPTEKKFNSAVDYRFDNPGFQSVGLLPPHSAFWGRYQDKPGRYIAVLRVFSGKGEKALESGEVRVVTLK